MAPHGMGTRQRIRESFVQSEPSTSCHWMELDNSSGQRVWAYHKAAWAIEDLEQGVRLICRQMGRKGLESIGNVGRRLVEVIEKLLQGWT
jgi:DNA polymerase/3'-5' exonuclease PolX